MLNKLLLTCVIFFLFTNSVFALTIIDDNFDLLDTAKWNFNNQGGSIISENGILNLRSSSYNFPIVLSKNTNFFTANSDIVFEVKFKYDSVTSMGNGISLGFTGPSGWPFYQFSVWNDTANGFRFVSNNFNNYNYNYCNIGIPDDPYSGFISKKLNFVNGVWHKFRIEKHGSQFNVYINKDTNPNPILSTSQNQCIPKIIFLGNQLGGGSTSWTSLSIDYIKIGDGLWTDKVQNKIVFLPGMGGSWNERAMVLNQDVAQSEWRMTPFVKNYDSMLNAFDTNNLVKNKDYFVYNYDWRKPMASQIIDFNNYVSGLGITGSEKVDIVGHSMGGLIGRIWTQENTNKVGKVITLGTPNLGSVKVYEMWNGAKISDSVDISSIAINVLLTLQRNKKQTAVETLQTYAPALKDLLPTFNYLKKNGANVTPPSNSYLTDKNLGVSSIFDKLLAVSGSGFKTKDTINLTERTVFDTMLGLWPQGRPLSYVEADGDVTVLKKSAVVAGDNSANVVSNHGEITNKSVNIVLSELGLGKTISYVAGNSFDGAVFYIGSPASLKVNCGADDINETDGFVLVAGKNMADCIVKLTGTENGTYHLVMGNSSDDTSFKYSEGNISIGDTKNISVKMVDFWYEQMIREINTLLNVYPTNTNLKNMKTAAVSKNRTNLISSYVLFRKQKIETIITWRMVDYLEKIINIEIPSTTTVVMNKQKNLALSAKALTDKTASLLQRQKRYPNTWQSLNYKQGEELLISPNYGKYLLAEKVFAMVWY